jgi:hypothetical protein
MANFRPSVLLGNAILNAIRDFLDAASGSPNAGRIRIYSGTQPATGGAALAGNTLLAELQLGDPSAPNASARSTTFNTISPDPVADNTGTATWARFLDGNGNEAFDCDVGVTGSGAGLEFATTSFVAGAVIELTSGTLTIAGT